MNKKHRKGLNQIIVDILPFVIGSSLGIFISLKWIGIITWSWWWVFSPILIALIGFMLMIWGAWVFHKTIE